MRVWRFGVTAFLSLAACLCFAVPKVLILQATGENGSSASPILLGDALAQSLQDEGKLDPIVWSETDPIFRDAVLDGRLNANPNPTPDQIQQALKALGCDYLITLKVSLKGTELHGHIDFFKGADQLWKDDQVMDPGRASENDLENTIRSAARTWALQLSTGPLHSLKSEPHPPETPAPAQGQLPLSTPTADPIKPQADSSKAIEEYQRLMAAKQIPEATSALREAVDASPLDAKLRVLLIQHLTQIGRAPEAAEEARRASLLLPDSPELRGLAAQAYINSGQSDQAEAQLNEALARNPEDPVTRSMLADIDLKALKPQAALEHLNVAFKKAPSKDLAYRLALCDALTGDATAVQNDLAQAAQQANWSNPEEQTYRFCLQVLDSAMDQSIGDLRSLNQRAAVKRNDPDVLQAIEAQLAILSARQMLVDSWTPPVLHKNSHGKRSLALKLLAQSLSELKAYLSDGSQDTLTDASIDLGEAIKQLSSARDALASEEGTVARHGSTTLYFSY